MIEIMAESFLRAASTSAQAANSWLDRADELELDRVADYLCGQHADHRDWRETHDTPGEYLYEMFVPLESRIKNGAAQ